MEAEIFDKETILDLMVNFIPLGIIFFFIAAFVLYDPWGFDPRFSGLMLAIMGGMFIALAVLTYISGKAIAGDEKRATVYPQGQAGLEGAEPIHEHDDQADSLDDQAEVDGEEADPVEADADADAETGTDADAETDADVDDETDADGDTEADTEADVDGERTDGSDGESTSSA